MKNNLKKYMVFLLVVVILFSVAVLGATACNCAGNNPNPNPCGYAVCVCEENTPIPNPTPNPCKQNPCICESNTLANYKINAIETLQAHVQILGKDSFTDYNWLQIQSYVANGVAVINTAVDKIAINSALTAAKNAINYVPTIAQTLETLAIYRANAIAALQAYIYAKGQHNYSAANWSLIQSYLAFGIRSLNNSWTIRRMEIVVAYYKMRICAVARISEDTSDCINSSHSTLLLSPEKRLQIRQDYANVREKSIDSISITEYYGTFNNASVVIMCDGGGIRFIPWTETVAGIVFLNPHHEVRIQVWYLGVFYTLTQAYNNGWLDVVDLQKIANRHLASFY